MTYPRLLVKQDLSPDGPGAEMENNMTTKTVTVEGQTVTIGDFIGFKNDIEQSGRLVDIRGTDLVLSVYDSMTGDRHQVTQPASRCWKE